VTPDIRESMEIPKIKEPITVSDNLDGGYDKLLNGLDEEALMNLRVHIDNKLPPTKLKNLDLEKELVIQFKLSQQVQKHILEDYDTPANQKAQVLNSVVSTIQKLVEMQSNHYTTERLKDIENAIIRTLEQWPESQTAEFFKRYEQLLEGKRSAISS